VWTHCYLCFLEFITKYNMVWCILGIGRREVETYRKDNWLILGVIDGILHIIFSFSFLFLYILYAYTLYIIMLYSEHIVIWTINLAVKMYYTMGLKETKNCLNHRLIVWHIYCIHSTHTHTRIMYLYNM